MHIFDEGGSLSPTAFIPFCSFGGNMNTVGIKSEQFDAPVCNSFKSLILNHQLCYQIDLEKFRDTTHIEKQLKDGLFLILDFNEERQMPKNMKDKATEDEDEDEGFYLLSDDQNSVQIHLETISIHSHND